VVRDGRSAGQGDGNDVLGLVVLERGEDARKKPALAGLVVGVGTAPGGYGAMRREAVFGQVLILRKRAPMLPGAGTLNVGDADPRLKLRCS
jgi:hypothetical protein